MFLFEIVVMLNNFAKIHDFFLKEKKSVLQINFYKKFTGSSYLPSFFINREKTE